MAGNDLDDFLSKVDEVAAAVQGLHTDREGASAKADALLSRLGGDADGKVTQERTLINRQAEQPITPIQAPAETTSADAFMQGFSADAEARAQRRAIGEREGAKLKDEGNVAYRQQKWARAENLYTQGLREWPDHLPLYTNRAAARLKLADFAGALSDCEWALRLHDRHGKALFRKAQALEGLGRFADAITAMETAVKVSQGSARAAAQAALTECRQRAEADQRTKASLEQEELAGSSVSGLVAKYQAYIDAEAELDRVYLEPLWEQRHLPRKTNHAYTAAVEALGTAVDGLQASLEALSAASNKMVDPECARAALLRRNVQHMINRSTLLAVYAEAASTDHQALLAILPEPIILFWRCVARLVQGEENPLLSLSQAFLETNGTQQRWVLLTRAAHDDKVAESILLALCAVFSVRDGQSAAKAFQPDLWTTPLLEAAQRHGPGTAKLGLQALQFALASRRELGRDVLAVTGALSKLAFLIRDNDIIRRIAALGCLAQAAADAEAAQAVVERGLQKDLLARALTLMSAAPASNDSKTTQDGEELRELLGVLLRLARQRLALADFGEASVVKACAEFLVTARDRLARIKVVTILPACLATTDSAAVFVEQKGARRLFKLLTKKDELLSQFTARALVALLESGVPPASFLTAGHASTLVEVLASSPSEALERTGNLALLVGRSVKADPSVASMFEKTDVIRTLLRIVQSTTGPTQRNAAMALSVLAKANETFIARAREIDAIAIMGQVLGASV